MKKILLTLSIIVCFGISQDLHAQIPNALQKKRAEMLQNAADSKEAEEAAKLEEQKKKEAEEASRLAEQKKRAEQEAARLEEEKKQKQQNDQHPPNQPPKDEREQAPTLGNQPAHPPVKTPSDQGRIATDADAEKAKKEAEAKAKAEAEAKARQEAEAKAKEEEKKKKATPYERPRKRVRTPISDPKTTLPKEGIKDKIEPKTLPTLPGVMIPATIPQQEEPKEEKKVEMVTYPIQVPVHTTPIQKKEEKKNKTYKLKITVSDIICEETARRNKTAEYSLTVRSLFQRNNQIVKPKETSGTSSSSETSLVGQYSSLKIIKSNPGHRISPSRILGDYVVYEISEEDLEKNDLQLRIHQIMIEGEGLFGHTFMLFEGDSPNVAVKDVVNTLLGRRNFNPAARYPYDNNIPEHIKFDLFDGFSLPLTKVNYITDKLVLEGPIRSRNDGKKVKEKAFVWYRFELID